MSEDTVALHKFNGKQYALARDVQPYFMELANARKRIEALEKALRFYAEYVPRFSEQDFRSVARAALEGKNGC